MAAISDACDRIRERHGAVRGANHLLRCVPREPPGLVDHLAREARRVKLDVRVSIVKRIVGLSMVRNEADIIESFVRHNVAFLDELHVIVQPSGDGTDRILGKLAEEGLPLVVIENNDAGFMQGEHLSSHARRLLATAQCDAVVVLDADEFIKAPDRTSLVNAISAIPAGLFGCWEWHSYVPTVEPTPSGEPITRIITHRR